MREAIQTHNLRKIEYCEYHHELDLEALHKAKLALARLNEENNNQMFLDLEAA